MQCDTTEDRVVRINAGKDSQWLFVCPGCGENHAVNDSWSFNGDRIKPTFNPSLLVAMPGLPSRCHSFVKDGQIQFLSDCTHALAGKTVDLPPCPYCQKDA